MDYYIIIIIIIIIIISVDVKCDFYLNSIETWKKYTANCMSKIKKTSKWNFSLESQSLQIAHLAIRIIL